MASGINPTELKYLLECGICLNRFQDPRVLPCLHSYCLECLRGHISTTKDRDGAFDCPQCRETCQVPVDGVDHFPKNFFVNAMKDVVPDSALEEPNSQAAVKPDPPMCKHHDEDSEGEHGIAVIYCDQCEAHLCLTCSKSHKLFFKDHKVVSQGDTNRGKKDDLSRGCKLHQNLQINWYCKECSLPACPECLLEQHEGHPKERLAVREAALKQDMFDVSIMAAKRLDTLQKISADLRSNETDMEEELDKVNKEITDTADSLCTLIRQHETTLKVKVKEARQDAQSYFKTAQEKIETAKANLTSMKTCAETLQQATPENAACTVLQAGHTKQQVLHQQDVPVPFVDWKRCNKRSSKTRDLSTDGFLGSIDTKLAVETDTMLKPETVTLVEPLRSIKLEYLGKMAVCGVVPIYGSNICISHAEEDQIWIYSSVGQPERKVKIPGVTSITGMVAVDAKYGKLAVVDNKEPKVHFVTVSQVGAVIQLVVKDMPIVPCCIVLSHQRELVVCSLTEKRCVVLNIDGQVERDIKLSIPHDEVLIYHICKTKSGLVVCDGRNQSVHFTDAGGYLLRTSTNCSCPLHVAQTSWGHLLVADHLGDEVRVFSEKGEFLGNVRDNKGSIIRPHHIYVDEAERLLYVCHGFVGEMEMKVYKLALSDLQPLPTTRSITRLTTAVNLVKV